MSINRVVITGNLTRDPELRATPSGMSILKMGIAVNDRRKNGQTGEWEDVANFFDVVVFGSRGEKISQYLSKGSKIAVDGKLRWSQWEKDGDKRSKVEIVADDVEFLSTRGEGGGQGGGGNYSPAPKAAASAPAPEAQPEPFGDDIPF